MSNANDLPNELSEIDDDMPSYSSASISHFLTPSNRPQKYTQQADMLYLKQNVIRKEKAVLLQITVISDFQFSHLI